MHKFIVLDDEILTLDSPGEIDEAVDALMVLGIQSIEVYEGGPEEQRETKLVLTAGGIQERS